MTNISHRLDTSFLRRLSSSPWPSAISAYSDPTETMRPTHLARYLARTLVLSRTVKLVSLGRAGLCFALAGEEGVPEVRSPPLLAAEVPEMLEDCDGRLGRLHRRQRRHRRRQRRQGLRLAQHLVEPVGPDDR